MLSAHLYPRGGVGGPSPDLQVDVPGPFPNPKVAEHEENHFKGKPRTPTQSLLGLRIKVRSVHYSL